LACRVRCVGGVLSRRGIDGWILDAAGQIGERFEKRLVEGRVWVGNYVTQFFLGSLRRGRLIQDIGRRMREGPGRGDETSGHHGRGLVAEARAEFFAWWKGATEDFSEYGGMVGLGFVARGNVWQSFCEGP
jgi:hypothetical protein